MDIQAATTGYEHWLAQRLTLIAADVRAKHQAMADPTSPFPFLRATFYRWAQVWPEVCPDLAKAPSVLAVGDLHVENFGTWRDSEGRLIWGVNDLDEAHDMPYPIDLVRVAVSANLAREAGHLSITLSDVCAALLQGYRDSLDHAGDPFVLADRHRWLRVLATGVERDPTPFWRKLDGLASLPIEQLPAGARDALEHLWPEAGLQYRVAHRIAGLGSLGRQRFLALADWRGGKVAREAKALAPSAWSWAHKSDASSEVLYQTLLNRAVRCPDPYVELCGDWIVRRLAPDCSRIELSSLPKERDEARLLNAMGWETANIHLGTPSAVEAVRRDLKGRKPDWLHVAATAMTAATVDDWKAWRSASKA